MESKIPTYKKHTISFYLKKLDIFSKEINLNHDETNRMSTNTGVCLSIILAIGAISILIIYLKESLDKKNPVLNESYNFEKDYYIDASKINMMISFKNYNKSIIPNALDYLSYYSYSISRINNELGEDKINNLVIETCQNKNFESLMNKIKAQNQIEYFQEIYKNVEDYYCFNFPSDFEIYNPFIYVNSTTNFIYFNKCKDDNSKNNYNSRNGSKCLKDENNLLDDIIIEIIYLDSYYDQNDYEYPVKYFSNNKIVPLSLFLTTHVQLEFSNEFYFTYDLFGNSISSNDTKVSKIETENIYSNFNGDNRLNNNLFFISLSSSHLAKKYERRYSSIKEIISQVGGFINGAYILLKILLSDYFEYNYLLSLKSLIRERMNSNNKLKSINKYKNKILNKAYNHIKDINKNNINRNNEEDLNNEPANNIKNNIIDYDDNIQNSKRINNLSSIKESESSIVNKEYKEYKTLNTINSVNSGFISNKVLISNNTANINSNQNTNNCNNINNNSNSYFINPVNCSEDPDINEVKETNFFEFSNLNSKTVNKSKRYLDIDYLKNNSIYRKTNKSDSSFLKLESFNKLKTINSNTNSKTSNNSINSNNNNTKKLVRKKISNNEISTKSSTFDKKKSKNCLKEKIFIAKNEESIYDSKNNDYGVSNNILNNEFIMFNNNNNDFNDNSFHQSNKRIVNKPVCKSNKELNHNHPENTFQMRNNNRNNSTNNVQYDGKSNILKNYIRDNNDIDECLNHRSFANKRIKTKSNDFLNSSNRYNNRKRICLVTNRINKYNNYISNNNNTTTKMDNYTNSFNNTNNNIYNVIQKEKADFSFNTIKNNKINTKSNNSINHVDIKTNDIVNEELNIQPQNLVNVKEEKEIIKDTNKLNINDSINTGNVANFQYNKSILGYIKYRLSYLFCCFGRDMRNKINYIKKEVFYFMSIEKEIKLKLKKEKLISL